MHRIRRLIQANASFVFDGRKIITRQDKHAASNANTSTRYASNRAFASDDLVFDQISRTGEPVSSYDMQSMLDAMDGNGGW